jgi:hypothetical protein
VRVAGAVLQIFLRAIRATLRRSNPAASSRAQLGAVSFFHRFGSSLNAHPHYHLVVLDGVFSKADDSEIAFHEAHGLTPDRIAQVESVVQKGVLRYFRRQGLLDDVDAAGMLNWQGSGGFSVDASVRIGFALERLHALGSTPSLASPESRLVYRFPKPDIHGRTELLLTPLELLEALAKFVPLANPLAKGPRGDFSPLGPISVRGCPTYVTEGVGLTSLRSVVSANTGADMVATRAPRLSCGRSRLAPLRSLRSLRVKPTLRLASRSAWVRTQTVARPTCA